MNRSLSLLAGLTLVATSWAAQAQTVKMATVAPENSTWHIVLKKIAERWAQESGGQVKLRIFAGGVQGDEGDCVKKMRIGQLHACGITGVSLKEITPEPMTISIPLLVTSYPELDHVMARVGPRLEQFVADKGFVILAWTDAGIMYFFGKKPAASVEEAFKQKVWAVSGDPGAEAAWRSAGFTPVVLSSINMLPSLQTGMIDAFTSTPLLGLSLGWYTAAPHMTDQPWGMLIGALVITKAAWDKFPPELQQKLMKASREEGEAMKPVARRQEAEAILAMQKKGLNIVKPTPEQAAGWERLSEKIWPATRGKVVPVEIFDEVKKARDEYRASMKK
jgi:TRAP-type C4-dicarboxylate transport system substrate-binding protein